MRNIIVFFCFNEPKQRKVDCIHNLRCKTKTKLWDIDVTHMVSYRLLNINVNAAIFHNMNTYATQWQIYWHGGVHPSDLGQHPGIFLHLYFSPFHNIYIVCKSLRITLRSYQQLYFLKFFELAESLLLLSGFGLQ